MLRRVSTAAIAVLLLVLAFPARAADPGTGRNIAHVANISWGEATGTDLEFATLAGREYAIAGTYLSGLKFVDVTDPARPVLLTSYGCGISQGDVQIFARGARTYATYTSDDGYTVNANTACFRDAKVPKGTNYGTFIIDITDPRAPKALSFVSIGRGSHNTTVHPSGRYLYNSNADLENPEGLVEVVDINDLAHPKVIGAVNLVTGLSSHDITFSKDGKRAYVAALTHTVILDTSDPKFPVVVGRIIDPAINIHHGSDPFTIAGPNGPRTFLIVSDELAGAAATLVCPGGGLHIYDITGDLEKTPLKVGVFFIPEVRLTDGDSLTCTAHVMQIHEKQKLMTIAWYDVGRACARPLGPGNE